MSLDLEIAHTFNRLFAKSHNTVIKGGASELLYKPPEGNRRSVIRYIRDSAPSALHEIAHWCIAGRNRRELIDYGYWYTPPPRSLFAQHLFFAVEARVQALESLFADVAGLPFHLSADDVHPSHGEALDDSIARADFAVQVERGVETWRSRGLPERADRMLRAFAGNSFDKKCD